MMADGWQSVRLDEIEPIPVVGETLLWRPRAPDARRRRLRDQLVHRPERRRRRRRGAHREDVRARGALPRPLGPRDVHARRRDARRARRDRGVHPRPGGEAPCTCGGAADVGARRRRPSRGGVRAGSRGSTRSRRRSTARRATTRRWSPRSPPASSENPDNPSLLYDLGCAEALAGRLDDALAHVARALELKPEWADHARKDSDLDEVRELPGWPLD